ncbi:MAG: phosphatidylinositol mannoside acyltransferase [Acidothermus sp.]|nr:phosphatidylinositol mannoside acyltransferase [Acidothermus sp.]MCL6537105.1 phosphatidylinositol mannoside acyltransferase [Acidothermus sp.]
MSNEHPDVAGKRSPLRRWTRRLRRAAWARLLQIVIAAAGRLSEDAVRRVFFVLADLMVWRRGAGVRQLERNLARVVGPDAVTPTLVRASVRSYARYWVEFLRLDSFEKDRILDGMAVEGLEHLERAVSAGRGVILALPHLGNWDQAGAWLALNGYPFTTVAERLRPESIFQRFVAIRQQLGMEVLALGSERGTFPVLARRLREGGIVCLVSDRDLAGDGVPVVFFGEPTTLPAGPAALACATGAALLPVELWFTWRDRGSDRDGWGARVHPPLAVPPDLTDADRSERIAALTQRLADAFAAAISAHPEDWHMMQPLWTADRRAKG